MGALAQFDWAKDDNGDRASKVDVNGWMIVPCMSARIHENIYFDLRAACSRIAESQRGASSGEWRHGKPTDGDRRMAESD